jgi:uncharacterized protein (DUF2249 family)
MEPINANTKINSILKQNADALEAIISISPKFNKLRNPLLRKLIASRTSISEAGKIAGVSVHDFFTKLKPLGFTVDETITAEKDNHPQTVPGFLKHAAAKNIEELDVRPVIESGKDPFSIIMRKIKQLEAGKILKLINSFQPIPLINILSKQGFEHYVETTNENVVNTYFYKPGETKFTGSEEVKPAEDWETLLQQFENNLVTIDVRPLEMPQPMLTILDELERLPDGKALYVYHKRIPVFLLPELSERNFDYRIKEISDGEVHLLIFKK